MFSMLGYILLPFAGGLMSASIGFPMTLLVIVHFFIVRPVGYGFTSDFDADVFYPLTGFMFSLAGWMFAWAYGLRNVFWGMIGKDKVSSCIWRALKGFAILVCLAIGVLAFELIPAYLWFGGVITLLVTVGTIWGLFWALFFRVRYDESAPLYERAYVFGDLKQPEVVPMQVAIVMTIVCVVAIVVFWPVYYLDAFWQFWIALILFGATFIFALIILVIVWMMHKSRSPFPTQSCNYRTPIQQECTTSCVAVQPKVCYRQPPTQTPETAPLVTNKDEKQS